MAALGAIPADALADYVAIGEMNLDGTLGAVAGALPAAIGANAIGKGLMCPAPSGAEAAWAGAEIDLPAPRSPDAPANQHQKGVRWGKSVSYRVDIRGRGVIQQNKNNNKYREE